MQDPGKGNESFLSGGIPPRLRVFLICLLISGFIWTTMVLSKDYSSSLYLSLQWENTGSLMVIQPAQGSELEVVVESQGYGLFRGKRQVKRNKIALSPGDGHSKRTGYRYVVDSRKLKDQISELLGKSVVIREIKPDSLVYYLCPVEERELSVNPIIRLSDELKDLNPGKAETVPPTVRVQGPSCILDTLSYVQTDTVFTDIDQLRSTVGIRLNSVYLSTEVSEVQVTTPLFERVEQRRTVAIQCLNVPNGFRVKTFPDSLELRFRIPSNRASLVRSSEFRVVASLPEDSLSLKSLRYLALRLESIPEDAESVVLSHDRVEFVLLEKE